MPRILLIQSRKNPTGVARERRNFTRAVGGSAQLDFLSALDERLAWTSPEEFLKGYDGVVFGGSADFDLHGGRPKDDPPRVMAEMILSRVRRIIMHAIPHQIPTLGVCFGHQLIAQLHGGCVERDATQGKFGSHKVHLTEEGMRDLFFKNMPQSFFVQYAHKDSVTNHPQGATLLATGDSCRFSALRYGQTAYTMQFHPEANRTVPHAYESPEASRIIPLWIETIVNPHSFPQGVNCSSS